MAKQKMNGWYDTFNSRDMYGLPWNEPKFEQYNAGVILQYAPIDKRTRKAIDGAAKTFIDELQHGGRRFYGKARIVHIESKSGRVYEILISYNTAVCMIDAAGRFIRLWNGYSATTAKHIDAFRRRCGLRGVGKNEWLALPVGKWNGGTENCIA